MPRDDRPIIRASELGDYEFCARSWWLRRVLGWPSRYQERLERGEYAHAAHGQAVASSGRLITFGIVLVVIGVVLAVLA